MTYNEIVLLGRTGKDAMNFTTKDGKNITKLSLATNHGAGDTRITDWHNLTIFESQYSNTYESQNASEIKKGELLFIKGRLTSNKYTNKNGQEVISSEIIVSIFRRLSYYENNQQQNIQQPQPITKTTSKEDFFKMFAEEAPF